MSEHHAPAEHWHVANGTPGYLFDSDLSTFDTRREAGAYALREARDERDNRNDAAAWRRMPTTSAGSTSAYERVPLARADTWTIGRRGQRPTIGRSGPFAVAIDRPHDPHSLPYQWEGWPCTDEHDDEREV